MKPGPRAKIATCHPGKKHWARNLCRSCYYKQPTQRANGLERARRNRINRAAYSRIYSKTHRRERTAYTTAFTKKQSRKLRLRIIKQYGSACACCGEKEVLFLTIDHVKGNGKQDRAKHGQLSIYRRIVKTGFPPDYQILCYNCNCGRSLNGGICPHQLKRL